MRYDSPAPGSWADRAACRAMPWAWFDADAPPAMRSLAAGVCSHCPVLTACASYARKAEAVGTWGGRWRGGHLSLALADEVPA